MPIKRIDPIARLPEEKIAAHSEIFSCMDPSCDHIHAVFYNSAGEAIAEVPISRKNIAVFQQALKDKEEHFREPPPPDPGWEKL